MKIFIILYWVGIVLEILIRAPFQKNWRKTPKTVQRRTLVEKILLQLLSLGMFFIPLIFSVTDWLDFADYRLPNWMGWAGVYFLFCAILLFSRAHKDLKKGWTPYLEIYQGHVLITSGIYKYIRHPMYASQWIWCIAQILLLQNWIAGPVDLILFIPFYFLRVRGEEKMMLETFGNKYKDYMRRTGSVFIKMTR
ncbi:MAG: protein-S-isoprenylcysteine O-methyltransferase [Flexilinea sp.]